MKPFQSLRRFRWSDVPKRRRQVTYITAGVAFSTYTMENKFKECLEIVGNKADIREPHTMFWLRVLFGRMRSRWVGAAADVRIPVALRSSIYSFFAWRYSMAVDEIRYPLDSFTTFNEFFSRKLVDGARPISKVPKGLVSPVDGTVTTLGKITEESDRVEQVKGATYNVRSFLGLDPRESIQPKSELHYVVLYLAPGNYHRFHSPCDLTFKRGRHFCGELLPVRPWFLERFNDVLAVNERVTLNGDWQFGFMSLVAVGAANCGSVFLDFDHKLKTNRLRDIAVHCGGDVSEKLYPDGVKLSSGDVVGGFRMGSTVVLVFESPKGFQWDVTPGENIKVGQPLGQVT
ncbi:Phosphatidylserine decarboxylase proenzyme 1 [Durusdinium trenchii]|uniref:phosphatidylserine decarboxylase n=1 Tax=Durusdinium trenchii TaxID=1381693 RepID=A0ABP0S3C7_9DINO